MNIGIDFDGVILDTERHNSFWADYYSHFVLNKKRLRNNTVSQELCFDWSKDNFDEFYKTYFMKASKDADFLPGVKEILQKLKDDGHKLYIISLRGFYHKFEVKPALDKIKKLKIDFDGVFFGIENKMEKCKELELSVMIEDNPENIEHFFDSNIKMIYLRDKNMRKLNHQNVIEVNNWVDIYKTISKL